MPGSGVRVPHNPLFCLREILFGKGDLNLIENLKWSHTFHQSLFSVSHSGHEAD